MLASSRPTASSPMCSFPIDGHAPDPRAAAVARMTGASAPPSPRLPRLRPLAGESREGAACVRCGSLGLRSRGSPDVAPMLCGGALMRRGRRQADRRYDMSEWYDQLTRRLYIVIGCVRPFGWEHLAISLSTWAP